MSAALHLAKPDDLDRLAALGAAFHAETGLTIAPEDRRAALAPLLEGIPHGAAYLIGPARAPMGYIIVSFGWSLDTGGMTARVDELYLRRAVRGRGIAGEILISLPKALAEAGVKQLHLEVARGDEATQRLFQRAGFKVRDDKVQMTRPM